MKKKLLSLWLVVLSIFSILSPLAAHAQSDDLDGLSFEELVEAADGSTVNFFGWGGDETLNKWLDEVYGPALKEKYNITLNRVPMDIDQILTQLSNEEQAGAEESEIDMIWINGENFKTARENDFLYGPFLDKLPNFQEYYDAENPENTHDFGYPIEGYEAPYSKAQLVMIKDGAKTPESPKSAQEILEYAKANPGQFTYPALPDFTGSAFVRNIIYEFVDYEVFQDMEADKEVVKEAIQPAIDYLNELAPYLWSKGTSYPADGPALNNLFMDGEVAFYQTYGAYEIANSITDGAYPETAESYVLDKGTIGNTSFIAVGKRSSRKAAALVAINEMLSPEMQLSKYEQIGELPVVDNAKLTDEQKEAFNAVDPGPGTIDQADLLDHRLPEMPAALVPIIEEIWQEEVAGK